jgi:hypothetical protein
MKKYLLGIGLGILLTFIVLVTNWDRNIISVICGMSGMSTVLLFSKED